MTHTPSLQAGALTSEFHNKDANTHQNISLSGSTFQAVTE